MNGLRNLMKLNDRRALITGACGRLGTVIAATLAELGADLVLVDLESAELEELSKSIADQWHVRVEYRPCNLEDELQRKKLIEGIRADFTHFNILINNAAFVGTASLEGWSLPFELQTVNTWRRAFEVNLTAVFELCQGLTPLLRASRGSSIVNIGSIYGINGPDWRMYAGTEMGNPAAYSASKGGLIQFTRWLSTTVAPNIRVNAISPGGIFRGQPREFVERYESKTPLGRMATEDDFRGIIAFLTSDLSKYVTGQNIAVDGGWGVW